jgi:hypothetical protein
MADELIFEDVQPDPLTFNEPELNPLHSLTDIQGQSLYLSWLELGYEGTKEDFLEWLRGNDGISAYEVWLAAGNEGTVQDYLNSLKGKSQYQSYLDTTTDNPPLSEAEWSASKKNEEWFRIAHQLSITTSVNYYQNGHYNIMGLTDSGKSDDNFLSSAGYTYHAFKNRKIKHLYLSIVYVGGNLTIDARISCLKSFQAVGAISAHSDVEQLFAEDIVLQSRKVFDFTAQVSGKTLETGKRLYIGLKKTGGTAQLAGIEYIICFEDV